METLTAPTSNDTKRQNDPDGFFIPITLAGREMLLYRHNVRIRSQFLRRLNKEHPDTTKLMNAIRDISVLQSRKDKTEDDQYKIATLNELIENELPAQIEPLLDFALAFGEFSEDERRHIEKKVQSTTEILRLAVVCYLLVREQWDAAREIAANTSLEAAA